VKVAHLDTGRTWRGGQAQVLHLIGGLIERGHDCTLLAPRGPLLERAREAGAETVAWSMRGDIDAAAVLSARRTLAALAPDIAHGHTARAHVATVFAGRACGARVVVARRVVSAVGRHPLSRWKYRLPVDRYLCVSRAVESAMIDSGIAADRLAVVPSAVPLETPEGGSGVNLRDLIGAPADAPVVGTVASLTAEKGSEVWIEAAAQAWASDARLHWVWIGEGALHEAAEQRVRDLGLHGRVHFLGFREQVRSLMSQFTVFVLPSLNEGLGTSILDAQALGVPVIASDVGGIGEIVSHDRTGWLFPATDAGALAAAVHRTLESPDARARWTRAARDQVRGYGVAEMVEATLREYRALLEVSSRGGQRSV